jgi:hypothetical protein
MPLSTMGMVAREYEQQQMIGLMQTLGPDSPITPVLLQGIVQSSSLSNREDIIGQLQKMSQPDPAQQQAQMEQQQLQNGLIQSQIAYYNAQAQKAGADSQQTAVETQLMPEETKLKFVQAVAANLPANNPEAAFQQRAKIAELALKEEDIRSNERIAAAQLAHRSTKQ